jgi:RNA polymerase sigma-70 factor, ECF subfamily
MLRLLRSGREADAPRQDRADPLRAIARAAGRGDRAAQRTLLHETGSALLRVIRAVLGGGSPELEDVFQEAMTSVHLALPGFRGECTTLHFVCRIGVQTAMNARRRRSVRARHFTALDETELADIVRDDPSPAELLAAARRRAALRDLLGELPETQAEALALHTMLGYTIEETSCVTGVPVDTVRSRLRAALVALRQAIQADRGRLEVVREES